MKSFLSEKSVMLYMSSVIPPCISSLLLLQNLLLTAVCLFKFPASVIPIHLSHIYVLDYTELSPIKHMTCQQLPFLSKIALYSVYISIIKSFVNSNILMIRLLSIYSLSYGTCADHLETG